MAKGDLFKRSLEAGTSFIDMTRERAEAVVKDWVEAGDLGKGRAPKAVEQVLDRSRKVSEELRGLIRREIANQVAALGLATREDLVRLEAKIDAASEPQASVAGGGARKSAATAKGAGGQAATASTASKASKASKATKAARPPRAAGAVDKAAGAGSAGGAGSAPGT
jgi:polyhydroxyalkanoate synthesis regulator phasin